jgi:hypothetical protein
MAAAKARNMTRNRVLNICAWLALAAYGILFAMEKLANREIPFGDEWQLALIMIAAICVLSKSANNDG